MNGPLYRANLEGSGKSRLSERDEALVIRGTRPRPNRNPQPRDPGSSDHEAGRPVLASEAVARVWKILILLAGMLVILGAWALTR